MISVHKIGLPTRISAKMLFEQKVSKIEDFASCTLLLFRMNESFRKDFSLRFHWNFKNPAMNTDCFMQFLIIFLRFPRVKSGFVFIDTKKKIVFYSHFLMIIDLSELFLLSYLIRTFQLVRAKSKIMIRNQTNTRNFEIVPFGFIFIIIFLLIYIRFQYMEVKFFLFKNH